MVSWITWESECSSVVSSESSQNMMPPMADGTR